MNSNAAARDRSLIGAVFRCHRRGTVGLEGVFLRRADRMNSRVFMISLVALILATSFDLFSEERPPRPIPEGPDSRERFLKLIERPRVPLNQHEQSPVVSDGFEETSFEFDSEAGQRVPGLLSKRAASNEGNRQPVVIVLHGTGGNKAAMKPVLRKLAARGVIAVAIDARFAGERAKSGKGSDAYRAAILETWKSGQGFPFLYDSVWDLQRLIDYLAIRSDVDASRIGAIGFSKGGIELYLAAAVDPRLYASVPCIGVQSFEWALEHNAWQSRVGTIQSAVEGAASELGKSTIDAPLVRQFYRRVVPGIDGPFDGPQMLPLIAPRPLLVINGDRDDRTPREGLEICISAARDAYQQAQASDHFEFRLQSNTGHAVTPESEQYALDWLIEQLKSERR